APAPPYRDVPFPTVGYLADDPAARELAERFVSAALPGRTPGLEFSGLRVRAYGGGRPDVAPSDAALILSVTAGDVHPCSIHGEIQAVVGRFATEPAEEYRRVFPLGESARFLIDPGQAP
ncbi:MAG: hypothetical protein HKO53_12825, partial [Gemmatimonadetes bacterium]|nr:hypothetical protein [Gemmatimonadota bacterium]